MKDLIHTILKRRLSEDRQKWLDEACAVACKGEPAASVLDDFTDASRKVGKEAVQLDEGERELVGQRQKDLTIDRWGLDEAARTLMLLCMSGLPRERYRDLALQCYEMGDSREQQSWLRALAVLPQGELFLPTAMDACRTNILPVLEAIACENPYPSIHFPELNFNQMVLKSLFNGIALSRIVGLDSRLNAELSRMAEHYRQERQAAGRIVPADIGMVL